jgi:hypothetical protein
MNTVPETPTTRWSAWTSFWFAGIDPVGLHILRLLAGLLVLAWLAGFAGYQQELFGLQGWFDEQAFREARQLDGTPAPISWSLVYLTGRNRLALDLLYWSGLAVAGLFALGVATRWTGLVSWLVVASFVCSPAIAYEADYLLILLVFYLLLGYLFLGVWNGPRGGTRLLLGAPEALLWNWRTPSPAGGTVTPSVAANVALRLLQVHFALVMTMSGLHKLQFGDWWSGLAFWYPLHPPLSTTAEQIRGEAAWSAWWSFGTSLAQYLVLAWQLAFPFFAWRRGWRVLLLGGAAVGWLGTLLLLGLPLFGPVLFLACCSYLTPEEWRSLLGRLSWWRWLLPSAPETMREVSLAGRRS